MKFNAKFAQWLAEHRHRISTEVPLNVLQTAFEAGVQSEKDTYAARANAERENHGSLDLRWTEID
jgi:hypothetical protein